MFFFELFHLYCNKLTAVFHGFVFACCFGVLRDRKEVCMGDDNSLTLTFNARNDGGGAYEAELYVVLPPEADYSGIARNNEVTNGKTAYRCCLYHSWAQGRPLWHIKSQYLIYIYISVCVCV